MLLENINFLIEFNTLLESGKEKGSVFMTMKRFSWKKGGEKSEKDQIYNVLVRVTLGSKKISTIVLEKDFDTFNTNYISICKANMTSLKKKVKPSKKK